MTAQLGALTVPDYKFSELIMTCAMLYDLAIQYLMFNFWVYLLVCQDGLKGAVHDFMGDFDVLHLVFCLAYMHKSAFID